MNNLTRCLLPGLLVATLHTVGIAATSSDIRPDAPFLRPPESRASWTIALTSKAPSTKSNTPPIVIQAQVTQYDDMRRETYRFSDNSTNEIWVVKGVRIVKNAEGGLILMAPKNFTLPGYMTQFDFVRLTWISNGTFRSTAVKDGKNCFVYHHPPPLNEPKNDPDNPTPPASGFLSDNGVAYVDQGSRTLVNFTDGDLAYSITYGNAPSSLTPPPEYARLLKEYQDAENPLVVRKPRSNF